ncbi:stalk domain-containing protein [Paenibacillus sp. LjRoot153]|uniref:stalk domain-containing protein n=1 Tax=Paenibacillus sp. LjRoot153 TaxID=3342270 RepID=UPI003ECE0FB0
MSINKVIRNVLFGITILSLTFIVPHVSAADSVYSYNKDQQDVLKYVNEIRSRSGIPLVELDPSLSKAAENHVNYLGINFRWDGSNNPHPEVEGAKGYTGFSDKWRIKAAGGSFDLLRVYASDESIAINPDSAVGAINSFISGGNHRGSVLGPDITKIGFYIGNGYAVLDSISPLKQDSPIVGVYPYDGMKDVPLSFYGPNEHPNPLEEFGISTSGYIISVTRNFNHPIYDFKASVNDSSGNEIPIYVSGTSIIPKKSLLVAETYTVEAEFTIDGEKQKRVWSFSTWRPPSHITTRVNGKSIFSNTLNPNGITITPMRNIFEALGATVDWNNDKKSILARLNGKDIEMTVNSNVALINGIEVTLDQPVLLYGSLAYVPIRFVSEALGAKVEWDSENRVVNITK